MDRQKTIDFWFAESQLDKLRLHLGCGSVRWPEWCNIDNYPVDSEDTHRGDSVRPDVWCDISQLSCSSGTVDVIKTVHVLEHFYKYQTLDLIREFYRVLKPGGIMVHEMPNLQSLILLSLLPRKRRYRDIPAADKDMIASQFYGASWERNHRFYPYHKYVWSKGEFTNILKDEGFDILLATGSVTSHQPLRDFAVVCRKPFEEDSPANIQADVSEEEKIIQSYGNAAYRFAKQARNLIRLMGI